jgi:hypothetical protein
MASIQLTREEAELGFLPDVCMRCGAPATVRKRRMFVSHPFWVYVLLPFGYLPYVIVAAILTQRARCYTHFCPKHKNHYRVRAAIVWGTLAALVVLLLGSFVLVVSPRQMTGSALDVVMASLCLGCLPLMICWLILIPIIQATAIHTADVTDRRLTLKRVSPAFVEAMHDYRDRPRGEDAHQDSGRRAGPRRSEPSQDVYEPERRRPIDPKSDAFAGE